MSNMCKNMDVYSNSINCANHREYNDKVIWLIEDKVNDVKHVPGNIGKTIVKSKIIDVTNLEFHTDEGKAFIVVYIHPSRNDSIRGFYLWGYIANMHRYVLLQCRDPPRGYIEIQTIVKTC